MVEVRSDKSDEGRELLNPAQSRKRSASGCDSDCAHADPCAPRNEEPRAESEKRAPLDLTQKPHAKKPRLEVPSQEQSEGEPGGRGDLLHLLTFPNKLWRVVHCDKFKSLRWDNEGVYLVIDVDVFHGEFLDGPQRPLIFDISSLKGFLRLLNLYGFRKVKYAQERSASLSAFLAEETELSKGNKLLFFYNPSFQRGCEHRLQHVARRAPMKSARMDGEADKLGSSVKSSSSEQKDATCLQEGDQGAQTYSGPKSEEPPSPSPPNSESMSSAWGNQEAAQNQDIKSEGTEPEADPGIFSLHLLTCVSNLSRSLMQVISALNEATSQQPQEAAALNEEAQFQAMISSWMFLCNTCFSLPLITALFLKPRTMNFPSQSNTDSFQDSEATGSPAQP
ncbi:heat shock transcription factor, X-linked-like [Scleropages formosus]|uniref:Heat shock transcription factor, X-linked-like n=1 Tax=Scleropages formosus TaxID=113540 RepID=A0A8C9SGD1_SCLFO|nr:heat shock transcription factor, X-linked-like [Scleropages formosus]